jgi:hypothetical protein
MRRILRSWESFSSVIHPTPGILLATPGGSGYPPSMSTDLALVIAMASLVALFLGMITRQ